MIDKMTRCMDQAAFLAHADCNLQEALDHARMGLRQRTLVSLNRAADAARMAKVPMAKTLINRALNAAKDKTLSKKAVVKAVTDATVTLVMQNRAVYRKCGANVNF